MRGRQKRGGSGREKTHVSIAGGGREGFTGILAFELVFEGWSVIGRLLGS